jgi:hypothetical protein
LIAVICLFAALFASWALMKTSQHATTSSGATTGMAQTGKTP